MAIKIIISFSILISLQICKCDDSLALKECSQKYNDSSIISAKYLNYGCSLVCEQNNQIFQHSILEGSNCPQLTTEKNKVCRNGICIDRKANNSYYSLSVQLNRGYFFTNINFESYVEVCIQRNNVTIGKPLKSRNGCDCQISKTNNNLEPKWDYKCPKTIVLLQNEKEFVDYEKVVIEVYNKFSQINQFYGNGFILLKDLLRDENNGKEIMIILHQDLNGLNKEVGRIFLIISWDFNSKLM